LFLVSEKTHDFLLNKFYFLLTLSVILSAGVFLLIQKKSNWPIVVGAFFLITFLLFVKLDYWLSLFSDKMISKFLTIFFAESYTISVYALLVAVALLLVGIILKIFKLGFFIEKSVLKFGKLKEEKKEKKEMKEIIAKDKEKNEKENQKKKK
jgi:hypothetical protein